MATIKGIDFMLYLNTGTVDLPVWTALGGQRSASISRSADNIETTHKGTDGWKEFETSFREWSIESEALMMENDVAYSRLEDAFNNNTKLRVQLKTENGVGYEGEALITDLPLDLPYDDIATISCTLMGTGALTKLVV